MPQTGQPQGFQTPTRKMEIYSTTLCQSRLRPAAGVPGAGGELPRVAPRQLRSTRWCSPSSGWCNSAMSNTATFRACDARCLSRSWRSTRTRPQHCSIEDGEWVVLETATGSVTTQSEVQRFAPSPGRRHAVRLVAGMPRVGTARLRPLRAGGGQRQPPHPQRSH